MKYPQLVSTRAVNAISDWLVSRLEQIGVEAPLIYSRLLLSLLHSSVQINDPIEFGNLEKYFSNQKGSKRFPPNDTETIKKFTAIQCLLDAVSTEQEISCIENLVDELFKKLIDLEKQSNEEEENINLLHHQLPKSIKSLDIEDPRKRYYRAFPALSKEMEDSVWLKKRNGNSLTWPSGSSGTSGSNMEALNNTAGVKRKNKRRRYQQGLNKGRIGTIRKNSCGGNSSPTWDTDFEGNWEMGTDLIKEFLVSQKNRNRSISESDASNFLYEKNAEKRMKPTKQETVNGVQLSDASQNLFCATNNLNKNTNKTRMASKNIMRDVNILSNLIADENLPYDELISFNEFDSLSNMSRQLYQDDIPCSDQKSIALQQQNDFAQFEAKFNSDVEALWNDNKGKHVTQAAPSAENLRNKKNIDNFWTNYYNHHYNNGYIDDTTLRSLIKGTVEETNDFYSLPSNFNKLERSDERNVRVMNGEKNLSSGGVFISDSIWSDNSLATINNCKDDIGFYGSCWESKKNLQTNDCCDGKDLRNAFNIAKWSECSFEAPFTPPSAAVHPPVHVEVGSARKLFSESYKHSASNLGAKSGTADSLQAQHQLSQPVSLPDYYESSLCCFATEKNNKMPSNILPVVVPQMHQALIPSSSQSIASSTRTVSLANHSKTSGFIEYSIVKSSSSFFQFNQTAKYDRNMNTNQSRESMALVTPSNPLSAPGLGDGANLSIPTVTAVNSSASSSSPLDDDDNLLTSYRTHFRPIKQNYADGYQFDISGSIDKIEYERAESGSLYLESEKYFEYMRVDTFLSDEDSSTSSSMYSKEDQRPKHAGVVRVQGLHPLKFRMKQTDKQCQTEDSPQTSATPPANQVIVAKKRNINEDLELVGNSSEEVDDATDSDCYFHEEASIDLDKWTMAEMGKKCADNNNTHTLWGMCPACTKEDKCVPANRLLKDELSIEADEIMSDLKYMQDLYICSDWENEDDENDTDSELDALKNDDDDDQSGRYGRGDSFDDHDDNMDNEEQEQIFYNITKLISDLLKPENAKSLVNVLNAGAGNKTNIFKGMASEDELVNNANHGGTLFDYQKNVVWRNANNNNNNEKYVGGLWSNDENIIWKREMKPWGNWPRMSDNKTATFLEKLNWKHANLADIWNNGTIAGANERNAKSSSSSSAENEERVNSGSTLDAISRSSSTKDRVDGFTSSSRKERIDSKMTSVNANNCNIRKQASCNDSKSAADVVDLVSQRRHHKKAVNCCAIAPQTPLHRSDRKRRHSASQNIGCNGNCSNDNGRVAFEWCVGSNREMSAKIGDFNKVEIMAKWESDASKLSSMINIDDCLSSSSISPKTTIITCKYWTTMDTTLASPYFMDKSSHYDGIGAMAMNPSSILRHVAVVSRPLTR